MTIKIAPSSAMTFIIQSLLFSLGGAFPRAHHSFDSILVLYQIFRIVTIPKEKAISQGYSFLVFCCSITPNCNQLDLQTGFVKYPI